MLESFLVSFVREPYCWQSRQCIMQSTALPICRFTSYKNYMDLSAKRLNISLQLRRDAREERFKNVRMTLLAQLNPTLQKQHIQVTASGQYEIMEAIQASRRDGSPLNFMPVKQYIVSAKGNYSEEFKLQVAKVVLQSYRRNGLAIASLGYILFDCDNNSFLTQVEGLQEDLRELIEANVTEDGLSLKNANVIAFLFYNILKWNEICQGLYFLPKFYKLFVSAVGYFDQSFVVMIEAASHCRYLLPEESLLQSLLIQQLPYETLLPITLMFLCDMIENYVCFDLSRQLFVILAKWIQGRLRERKFSAQLKQNLIRIMTTALSYDQVQSAINQGQCDLTVFREIANLARLGHSTCKQPALACLATLAVHCSPSLLQYFVECNQLMEILIYSMELQLDDDLTYKIIDALAYTLCDNWKYRQMALNYGLRCHLNRLAQHPQQRINDMVQMLENIFAGES